MNVPGVNVDAHLLNIAVRFISKGHKSDLNNGSRWCSSEGFKVYHDGGVFHAGQPSDMRKKILAKVIKLSKIRIILVTKSFILEYPSNYL